MTDIDKYPIHICESERNILCDILFDKRREIPLVWKQFVNKDSDIVYMSAFEQGFVMSCVATQRDKISEVWRQLMDAVKKFRVYSGVKITDLGNSMIRLEDNYGVVIVRPRYEWE